jgi:hypothetical protein
MTDRPTKIVINCSTGEREIIELTDDEMAEREAMAIQAEADRLAQEEADQAKTLAKESATSKLAALGLTQQEIQALLS